MSFDAAVGKHLAVLREQTGTKQNEVAKRLSLSPAVLSRVESGERLVTDLEELQAIVTAIGTPEALKFAETVSREWLVIPAPSFDDSDGDLLWEAEQAAKLIHALAEEPSVKHVFTRRLRRYEDELLTGAKRVLNKRFNVACVGSIGVGKSTALCRAQGLELPGKSAMPTPVLETGGGGVTICEVRLRQGPGYGLMVEPCSEAEVRRHVADFASFLHASPAAQSSDDGETTSAPSITKEVERAIRNMAGFRKRRAEKLADGTVSPAVDDARDLAKAITDTKALAVEILARMELHKRDRRDLWHADPAKSPKEWLRDVFQQINNGRHSEFSLPKRIEMFVPDPILGETSVELTLIDTKGIDDIAERADLEQHFDDAHTATILCSSFNDAPSAAIMRLMTRAKEGGVRNLAIQAAVLGLPRPGEALAVKDNDGYVAQSIEDGYELKGEEVGLRLHNIGLPSVDVGFFNSAEDEPERLQKFMLQRVAALRDHHRANLRQVIDGANALLQNYEKEQSREVMLQAAKRLRVWLDKDSELPKKSTRRLHDSLASAVGSAHPRTVHASVVREGQWTNLDFSHQLSHGARRILTQLATPKLEGFKKIAENLLQDDDLKDGHDLVQQALRSLESVFDDLVRKVQLHGQSVHENDMRADAKLWRDLSSEWGQGKGYRERINDRNDNWFVKTQEGDLDAGVSELIRRQWKEGLEAIRELVEVE